MRVAVGCSYTAGAGVEPNEAYPCLMGYDNWAKSGTDIEYSLWCAHRAVEQGAEQILFQLTSWDRISLSTQGRNNFSANRPWTGAPAVEHYTLADYVDTKDNNFKWLYENHVMSNWRTENLAHRLVEFNSWAAQQGCTVDFYDWLPRNTIAIHPSVELLLNKPSVLDWLGDNYFVDDYYHVNAQGHRQIAENYFDR